MNCYQVCNEYVDGVGCAAGFLDYYSDYGTSESKSGSHSVGENSVWTSPSFIALLIAVLAALAMGIGFASRVSGCSSFYQETMTNTFFPPFLTTVSLSMSATRKRNMLLQGRWAGE